MKNKLDLSLYLITHRNLLLEDFFRVIQQAIAGGVKIVQLREKNIAARDIQEIGRRLQLILQPKKIPLIINDRVDVAYTLNANGVHLGQADITVSEARKILGKKAIIGLSVENIDQVMAAQDEEVDYLAASPVFLNQTKENLIRAWGFEGLKKLCMLSRHPVIAVGGINQDNVEQTLRCGASGIAVVSAVFDAACPKSAAQVLTNKIESFDLSYKN